MMNLIDTKWRIPDDVWKRMECLLPTKPRRGRSLALTDREIMQAIFYVLYTDCGWKGLPPAFGAWRTVYRTFLKWRRDGVFERMWMNRVMSKETYGEQDWKWPIGEPTRALIPLGRPSDPRDCATFVEFDDEWMIVHLVDDRKIVVPWADFKLLRHSTLEQRNQWELIGGGEAIHWEELDEDLGVEGLARVYPVHLPEQAA